MFYGRLRPFVKLADLWHFQDNFHTLKNVMIITQLLIISLFSSRKNNYIQKGERDVVSNLAKSYSLLKSCLWQFSRLWKNRKRFNIEKWSRDEIMTRLNSHNARAIWWSSTHRDTTKLQSKKIYFWWQIALNLTLRLVSCTSLWIIWIASPSGQTLTRVTSDLVGTTSSGTAGSTPAFVQIGTL